MILEVRNRAAFYETPSVSDGIHFFSFVQNSRGAGKGKVHSFGKRDQAIKRNLNVPVVVRGWLYKQVSWASSAVLHLHRTLFMLLHRSSNTAPFCVCNNKYYVIKISVFLMSTPPPSLLWSPLWFSLKMWIQTCPCCISEQLQCCVSPLCTSRTALECGCGRGNGLFCQTTACSTTKVSLWKGTRSVTVVNSAGV